MVRVRSTVLDVMFVASCLGRCLAAGRVGTTTPVRFCEVPNSAYYVDKNGSKEIVQEYFECPGPDDPTDYTVCCSEKCCPIIHIDSVLGVDIKIAMAISITVIVLCLVTGVTLVVCCFWSPCPMYDTCGGGYKRREGTLPFGDYDCRDTDPLTSNGSHSAKYYTAHNIDITVTKASEHV